MSDSPEHLKNGLTYADAGGEAPVVLFHDETHGEGLIDALARHGDGLPARVLPMRVNEISSLDLAVFAGAFAWGAAAVRLLANGAGPLAREKLAAGVLLPAKATTGCSPSERHTLWIQRWWWWR